MRFWSLWCFMFCCIYKMKTKRKSKSNHQRNSNGLCISNNQPALSLYLNYTNDWTLHRCLYMTILFYVLAKIIAIWIFRMYRPVPSKPFSWLFCLVCWMDSCTALLFLEWMFREWAVWCIECLSDNNTTVNVSDAELNMVLSEIKTLIISPDFVSAISYNLSILYMLKEI